MGNSFFKEVGGGGVYFVSGLIILYNRKTLSRGKVTQGYTCCDCKQSIYSVFLIVLTINTNCKFFNYVNNNF